MIDTTVFQDKKAVYYTLGCKLNFAETSSIGKSLKEAGIRTARRGEKADIIVVNTCSVTEVADKKCRQAIHKLVKAHPGAYVIVTGCYAQLKPDTVAEIEGVDLVLGAEQKGDLMDYLDEKGIEYVEKTGTNNTEVTQAADALIAAGVDAVFTPTDNTVMTAELAIYEKFIDAGIPHYCGADSFALNGAFCGYGVDYAKLGVETADMVIEVLQGADPATTPIKTFDNGIATVNTETAEALGIDYSGFAELCTGVVETVTAEEFK